MSRYRFVAAEKLAARAVSPACLLLEVSRSAYYQWSANGASPRRLRDAELGDRIAKIHGESRRTYGAPRVHHRLRRDGIACSRKRVARLMAERRLVGRGKRRSKRTTVADPAAQPVATDLVQRAFTPPGS